jgi:UDP-4-amino-4,6-dideoxy-L-N-acetyl-beta-L-altrosamine transaminase
MIFYGKQSIDQDDINSVVETLKSNFLTTGPKVAEFEKSLAKYCGAKYAIALSSGTAALHLSSLTLLQKDDKVLTTPNSFLATSNSILYAKAKPIFVDIDENGLIDLDICEQKLKEDSSIKAIYGVAFSGKMLNQDRLKEIRSKYNVLILEDLAHAIGASYTSNNCTIKAGSCTNSDISIFSFHPVKTITTAEGGAITTNNKKIYEKILLLRNHGINKTKDMKPWEYEMTTLGFNYRITDLQCALGVSQLSKLDNFISKRQDIAKRYDEAFRSNRYIKPLYNFDNNSSYHLYVVRVDFDNLSISKEELFIKIRESGVSLQLHYIPINKQPYYQNIGYGDESTPNMDRYYKEVLSLPIYPDLDQSEQELVISLICNLL